jgi:DNA-binding NtrC family response regulator
MFPQFEKTGHVPAVSSARIAATREILRAAPQDPAARQVLVVDDEPLMRWSMAESLRDQHYGVIEAADGAEALRALSSADVDAIVLDYRLPDSDDLALLARIRQLAPLTPVVMISAHSRPDISDRARDMGVHTLIEKPFEMRMLAAILARAHDGR